MWQQLRQHRAEIPARLEAQRTRSALASLEPLAQVEQHESSSRDIKLDLTVALSYETDIILEHRGERNVPKRFLKEARWDAHNEPDGTINLGYFAQDRDGNYIAVDFDFNTLTWGTTHRTRTGKYRLTIPAPIELGLRIVDEERLPRSDWGEIDGGKNRDDTPDEQSEEEDLDSPKTPAAGNTDEEAELQKIAESIPTPTNLQPGNLFAPSIFTPSAFMASTTQTTTQVQPPPTVPLSSSAAGKATAGGSGPPGGGGGQGIPNPLNNPFGPPGGGNPGGGGGNPGGGGGNPGGGGGGNPAAPHDKLSGQQPTLFDGDRKKSEAFMQEWTIYRGINRFTPQMTNPFSRILMFLSFIKGDKVHEWTQAQLRWAVDYVAQAPGNDNHEYVWDTVADAFFRAFTNITREVDAQTDIKTLKMKGDHGLDDYISTFERLARLGGYNLTDRAVIDMFVDGLPNSLAINVAKFNNPRTFNEWKRGAVEHHTTYLWIKSRFHKKSETRPTQDQWKKAFTKKGDDAMDTTPGRVKARATNTRPPLNDDEREKLRKEGRCFRCRKQGHLSRYCPEKASQARSNPQEEESEEETIQATTSKPPPKPTNPFLVKKKTTAQDIIRLITDAEDDVKDTIIQEVFMKQDF